MIYVVATSELKEGCREKFIEIAKANIPNVLAEEGCIRYEPCFDIEDGEDAGKNGKSITFIETWESEEHLKAHLQSKHMLAYVEAVKPLCGEGRSLKIVRPC